jgi:hypothetical protein
MFLTLRIQNKPEALVKVFVVADTPLVIDAAFGLYTETIQALKVNDIPVG